MSGPVLVYAICLRPRVRIALVGMAGEPLALVPVGGLAAVVGALEGPPEASIAALCRYNAVLCELANSLPAVLPVRFGTCIAGVQELAFVLRAREASLKAALREVRGRVQMTLRGTDTGLAEEAQAEPDTGQGGSGRDYLHGLARAAARDRAVPGLAPVVAAVSRWVRAERVECRGELASVYHLIPRGSVEAYAGAARRAAQEKGVPVVLTGPFPAYAFGGW